MPDGRRKNCRRCKRHESEVGPISWAGYCFPCGDVLRNENALQLHAHSGPAFKRWRERTIAAMGAMPLEEVRELLGRSA